MKWFHVYLILTVLALGAASGISETARAQTSDTKLEYASYIGFINHDNQSVSVLVNPQKELVVAFNSTASDTTQGCIYRYSGDGKTVLSSTKLNGKIHDIDVSQGTGTIAVVGDFGLKVFDATATQENIARSKSLDSGAKRVAIDSTGRVVASVGDTVILWATDGTEISRATTQEMTGKTDRHVYDVAISTQHGKVYVGGYRQASSQYQSPFLYAFETDLTQPLWRMYDYWQSLVEATKPYALTADSRLYRIEIGQDNGLYILGEAHGGTTVFKTDGTIPASSDAADVQYITPVEIDNWNKMHDTNSAVKTFVGKVDPVAGKVVQGQFILPRWDKDGVAGAGASTRNYRIAQGSLAVDEQGTVYVGASTGTYIKGRFEGTLTINGIPVGELLTDDEAKVLGVSQDEMVIYGVDASLTSRSFWTVLTKQKSNGTVNGFAAAHGIVAFVGTSSYGELMTTSDAVQSSSFNGSQATLHDAYLAVLGAGKPLQPVGQPPVVADIPDQRIVVGASFAPINLDEYVKDPDGDVQDITWSYSQTHHLNVSMTVSGTHRMAQVSPKLADWVGTETITLTATDKDNLSASDAVTFTVAANQRPVARDDSAITLKNTPVQIAILANDSDVDGSIDPSSITVATYSPSTPDNPYAPGQVFYPPDPYKPDGPPNGIVTVVHGTLIFSPTGAITGTRTFTYTVRDRMTAPAVQGITDTLVSNEALVTIVMKDSVTDTQVIEETRLYTTTASTTTPVTVTDVVTSVVASSLKVVSQPATGTVQVDTDRSVIAYTPQQGFLGREQFVYLANDAESRLWYVTTVVDVVERTMDDSGMPLVYLPFVQRE